MAPEFQEKKRLFVFTLLPGATQLSRMSPWLVTLEIELQKKERERKKKKSRREPIRLGPIRLPPAVKEISRPSI